MVHPYNAAWRGWGGSLCASKEWHPRDTVKWKKQSMKWAIYTMAQFVKGKKKNKIK